MEESEEDVYFSPEIDKCCNDCTINDLVQAAYSWDGSHHKLWWIEQIAARLGIQLPEGQERGIAP